MIKCQATKKVAFFVYKYDILLLLIKTYCIYKNVNDEEYYKFSIVSANEANGTVFNYIKEKVYVNNNLIYTKNISVFRFIFYKKLNFKNFNIFKSIIFGMLFSISWTPCIGTFLSSALLLIAKGQNILKGIILMLIYSVGLGIPFIISTILIEKLKKVFDCIKKHYDIIKRISGIILIGAGVYMIFL